MTINLGIVGFGHVAEHQLAAARRVDGVTVTDVCDTDPGRRKSVPTDIRTHSDIASLASEPSVDLVLVATPTRTHTAAAQELLGQGCPVCIEKPACLTHEDLRALTEAAERHFIHIAFHAAFAAELEWWLGHSGNYPLGRLVGIRCGFFDPYVEEGQLKPGATALCGSFVDSAINALSVLNRLVDLDTFRLVGADFTRVPEIACDHVSGTASYSFRENGLSGLAVISTNWTISRNSKTTLLIYERGEVLLDHSAIAITLADDAGTTTIFRSESAIPRLEQHYMGLFENLCIAFAERRSNFRAAISPHMLMIDALEASR